MVRTQGFWGFARRSARVAVATVAVTALGTGAVIGLAAGPAAAADPGSISGRVTNAAGGAGIEGICVGAYVHGSDEQTLLVDTATAADGTYTITNVPSGAVDVRFSATGFCPNGLASGFVGEWYNNQPSEASANPVTVNPDATTSNINASLANGGTISGKVTNVVGGAGLSGICVAALIPGGDDALVTSNATNPDGTYALTGVPSGGVHVEFFATGFCPGGTASDFVTQWYNNQVSVLNADTVNVAAGGTTANINAALRASGSISGKVTDANGGAAIAGICISVYEPYQSGVAPQLVTSTATAADGTYTLDGAPVGANDVKFYSSGFCPGGLASNYAMEWYNNEALQSAADVVTVSASATTPNINASLVSGGSMSGKVTAKTGGAGLNGMCVAAFSTGDDPVVVASIGTNPDGTYQLDSIPPGTVRVRFNSQGFCPGGIGSLPGIYDQVWYSNAADFDSAQDVTINVGQTTPNINAALVGPSSFSIKVNGSSTTSTVGYGSTVAFSETGIPTAATGSVVFSSSGHSNLCTITLPATSCNVASPLAVGSYTPISASFHDTDGGLHDSTSTNTVGLTVNVATTSFSIAANGVTNASVVRGNPITLSASGISTLAHGSVVFSTTDNPNVCTVTLPTTSCELDGLAVASYGPVSAAFTSTDGNFTSAAATNTVSYIVSAAPTSFTLAVNGGASAAVSRGATLTFSESGLPVDAAGTVTFSTTDRPNLCTATLPATSCDVVHGLPVGSYGPISATFVTADLNYAGSTATNTVTADVAPVAPSAPRAAHYSVSSHNATVRWSAPSDNGGSSITAYSVTLNPGHKTVAVSGATTEATFANLNPGSTYEVTITATNMAGTGPASSLAVSVAKPLSGYWMLGAGGQVYAFGNAKAFGNAPGAVVAMTARRDGSGYWTVDSHGTVHAFGAAALHGGNPALRAGESVSTIASTPSGNGYWLFTDQGRAFAYGDAQFFGDMAKVHLNGPIVASAATATGKGYYMVGSDGGVFSFGDAKFHGSTGAMKLNKPIVGISPTPDNRGYWLVASDGGVFAFGAPFRGSMGSHKLNKPVNGLVAFGNGYLMVASDGGIFDFSNKPFVGSLGGVSIPAPIIGVTAFATE
jgi:hypothetical protein